MAFVVAINKKHEYKKKRKFQIQCRERANEKKGG